jgi:hypothetical protein
VERKGELFGFIMAITFGPLGLALALRLLLTRPLHGAMPRVEAALDRWWTWSPLATVVVGAWWVLGAIYGLAFAAGALVLIQLTDERVDAPFRVRRAPRP